MSAALTALASFDQLSVARPWDRDLQQTPTKNLEALGLLFSTLVPKAGVLLSSCASRVRLIIFAPCHSL